MPHCIENQSPWRMPLPQKWRQCEYFVVEWNHFNLDSLPVETVTRRFTIDPNAIRSLIRAQAGSLQKAMLEAVANSIDAGATRIDVSVSRTQVTLKDDGKGLTKEEDIYTFFENFGFDHAGLERQVGRFGVGRGQLFCFGINTWRTHTFEMNIDMLTRDLDYDLKKNLKKHKGMSITIDLNDPLSASDELAIEEEFRELVRYSAVPVFYNGEPISEDPSSMKWTHETDDAWIQVRKDGALAIYSQGLFVKSIRGYEFGCGGKIITKLGRPLEQNMARNDLLTSSCAVWKRVKADFLKQSQSLRNEAKKDTYITPDMRKSIARQALTPTGAPDLLKEKLFTLVNNKHTSLDRLLATGFVSVAPLYDQRGDKLIQNKQAMVLEPATLERFGVDTPGELKKKIIKALDAQEKALKEKSWVPGQKIRSYHVAEMQRKIEKSQFFDNLEDVPFDTTIRFETVPFKLLKDDEKVVAHALRQQMRAIGYTVARWKDKENAGQSWNYQPRILEFYEDDEATEACTDGKRLVYINRKTMMAKANRGVSGFMELMSLLVHEHLHDNSSQSSHSHNHEFFEDFHNILLDGNVAHYGLSAFALSLRHGHKPTAKKLSQLENLAVDIDASVGTGEAFSEGPEPSAARPALPPKTRKPGRKS